MCFAPFPENRRTARSFFFAGNIVMGMSYLDMSEIWLFSRLREHSEKIIFKLDGAPPYWLRLFNAHFTVNNLYLRVREFPNNELPERWIGRKRSTDRALLHLRASPSNNRGRTSTPHSNSSGCGTTRHTRTRIGTNCTPPPPPPGMNNAALPEVYYPYLEEGRQSHHTGRDNANRTDVTHISRSMNELSGLHRRRNSRSEEASGPEQPCFTGNWFRVSDRSSGSLIRKSPTGRGLESAPAMRLAHLFRRYTTPIYVTVSVESRNILCKPWRAFVLPVLNGQYYLLSAIIWTTDEGAATSKAESVAVRLMRAYTFYDWLIESLGTGLVSYWLLHPEKGSLLAGLPGADWGTAWLASDAILLARADGSALRSPQLPPRPRCFPSCIPPPQRSLRSEICVKSSSDRISNLPREIVIVGRVDRKRVVVDAKRGGFGGREMVAERLRVWKGPCGAARRACRDKRRDEEGKKRER
ncbi:hypothetical protein PR048_010404 [Dryococelus australis]|uniref:Uncharacterized protein n=1 Tax=Dryococelus australis TaxID=614101 RepID=A0ABQ9I2K8_9NEOP|nr:hypothetical protein PR048_010404 [Dryococelus australis]